MKKCTKDFYNLMNSKIYPKINKNTERIAKLPVRFLFHRNVWRDVKDHPSRKLKQQLKQEPALFRACACVHVRVHMDASVDIEK